MKKLLVIFCILFIASSSEAQDWPTVKIDSAVSVQLPKGFEKNDTTAQVQFLANSPFGTIMVFKSEDNPRVFPDIERDRHLDKYYNNYIKSISRSSAGGSIINEKDTLLGELKVKDFTLQVDSGSGKQYREFRIFHANGATYTFQFLYQHIHKAFVDPEKEKFFNSIKINETFDRQDQYTAANAENEDGISGAWLVGLGAILLIFILLLLFFRRRRG